MPRLGLRQVIFLLRFKAPYNNAFLPNIRFFVSISLKQDKTNDRKIMRMMPILRVLISKPGFAEDAKYCIFMINLNNFILLWLVSRQNFLSEEIQQSALTKLLLSLFRCSLFWKRFSWWKKSSISRYNFLKNNF